MSGLPYAESEPECCYDVQRLRDRLETSDAIRAFTRIEAVYPGPTEVLVAADVQMTDGLAGDEVADHRRVGVVANVGRPGRVMSPSPLPAAAESAAAWRNARQSWPEGGDGV